MTATRFHELLTRAIAEFKHDPGCFEAPVIKSNPSTGEIGVVCNYCGKAILLTVRESGIIAPDSPEPGPKPRFKIP